MTKSSFRFGMFAFIVGAVSTILLVAFAGEELALAAVKVVNKFFNAGLVLGVFVLYKYFFKGRFYDSDAKIGEHPIAIALDSGLLAIASALAISGAF